MKLDNLFKQPNKNFFGVILGLLCIVFIAVLFRYNNSKSSTMDSMKNFTGSDYNPVNDASMNPLSASTLNNNEYLQISSHNSCMPSTEESKMDPQDLLPKDTNSEWASVNPASNDLKNMNLLTAGQLIGINTVGNSLRNANYQERSEPIIPKNNIGPWNNSTIDADTFRRPLEIGNV